MQPGGGKTASWAPAPGPRGTVSARPPRLTEVRLGHHHGPLGHRRGAGGGVEAHVIQGLIHHLPGILPCRDFFYVTKRRKTISVLIVSSISTVTDSSSGPRAPLPRGPAQEGTVPAFAPGEVTDPHPGGATTGILRGPSEHKPVA